MFYLFSWLLWFPCSFDPQGQCTHHQWRFSQQQPLPGWAQWSLSGSLGVCHCRAARTPQMHSQGVLHSIPGSSYPHKWRKICVIGPHMLQGLKKLLCLSPDPPPYPYWEECSQLGNLIFRASFYLFPLPRNHSIILKNTSNQ